MGALSEHISLLTDLLRESVVESLDTELSDRQAKFLMDESSLAVTLPAGSAITDFPGDLGPFFPDCGVTEVETGLDFG